MIPLFIAIIVSVFTFTHLDQPLDVKLTFAILLFFASIFITNNIIFVNIPKRKFTKVTFIQRDNIKLTGLNSIKLSTFKTSLSNVTFLHRSSIHPKGLIKVTIPYIESIKLTQFQKKLLFTLPGLWLSKASTPKYYPSLGNITIYSHTITH